MPQDRAGTRGLVHWLRRREISASLPGAAVNHVRETYNTFKPTAAATLSDPPNNIIFKFTPSGEYLVCFGHLLQDLIIYRFVGHKPQSADDPATEAPVEPSFNEFFHHLYSVNLAHDSQVLCRDCCLVAGDEELVVVASSSPPMLAEPSGRPQSGAAEVHTVPFVARTTLHLVKLRSGQLLDTYTITDDFVSLSNNGGIHLYEDIMVVLAIRSQSIHVVQLRPSGHFLLVQVIGQHLHADDRLVIATAEAAELHWQAQRSLRPGESIEHLQAANLLSQLAQRPKVSRSTRPALAAPPARGALGGMTRPRSAQHLHAASHGRGGTRAGGTLPMAPPGYLTPRVASQPIADAVVNDAVASITGLPISQAGLAARDSEAPEAFIAAEEPLTLIEGIRHAVLTYLFKSQCSQAVASEAHTRFYYHFNNYMALVMWKVQMLDPDHLLLALGPRDAATSRSPEASSTSYILALYCMSSGQVVDIQDSKGEKLMELYLWWADHFCAANISSDWERFITPAAVIPGSDSQSVPQAARRGLAGMPPGAQMLSASPFLDARAWQYDARHVSPLLRFRPLSEQPLRFVSTSDPLHSRFRITLPEAPAPQQDGSGGSRAAKTVAALHFHPVQPFVLCVLLTSGQAPQLHVYFHP
ncbi:hypothetical protein WJX73_001191 [Symbiochloris irregularis]|uniref:Anaphase-promoting complex subunit 1 n=1 Tax=Symbiochloris irregularis TaxID=706552 RepID=A0AAW1P4C7_9CHLO